jgi:hypothetical protein
MTLTDHKSGLARLWQSVNPNDRSGSLLAGILHGFVAELVRVRCGVTTSIRRLTISATTA